MAPWRTATSASTSGSPEHEGLSKSHLTMFCSWRGFQFVKTVIPTRRGVDHRQKLLPYKTFLATVVQTYSVRKCVICGDCCESNPPVLDPRPSPYQKGCITSTSLATVVEDGSILYSISMRLSAQLMRSENVSSCDSRGEKRLGSCWST